MLGSAHCRKICSLKRHVPFDALYIICKVVAVTAPHPAREENADRSISQPNSDNLPDIGDRPVYLLPSRALIDYTRQHRSALSSARARPRSAHSLEGMKLLSAALRHFVSVLSRLLRFTMDAPNRMYRMSQNATCRRLVSVNCRQSWRRHSANGARMFQTFRQHGKIRMPPSRSMNQPDVGIYRSSESRRRMSPCGYQDTTRTISMINPSDYLTVARQISSLLGRDSL